jgi:hypothetical protein
MNAVVLGIGIMLLVAYIFMAIAWRVTFAETASVASVEIALATFGEMWSRYAKK